MIEKNISEQINKKTTKEIKLPPFSETSISPETRSAENTIEIDTARTLETAMPHIAKMPDASKQERKILQDAIDTWDISAKKHAKQMEVAQENLNLSDAELEARHGGVLTRDRVQLIYDIHKRDYDESIRLRDLLQAKMNKLVYNQS